MAAPDCLYEILQAALASAESLSRLELVNVKD